MKALDELQITALNDDLQYELSFVGVSLAECVDAVADVWDLILVAEDDTTRLYRTKDWLFVNCWLEGVLSDRLEDGGIGFDAQVELWEEVL